MFRFLVLLVVCFVFAKPVEAYVYPYNAACARELSTFCRTAEIPRVQDCIMENEWRLSPECRHAMQRFNLYNQEWYPDARIQWLRAYDYDRRRRY